MYPLVKGPMDRLLALFAIVVLSPLFVLIAIVIKLDSSGPVFFKQRRIGKDKTIFQLLKFRTMRVDTPSEVPTHMMTQASSYITKSGSLLRKTSLDELPQLFNVLQGTMSLVGPRPALWNQDDLIALREAQGVHRVKPGITGYAQVKGRDELPIPQKAQLDVYYVNHQSLWLDVKILILTVFAVVRTKGVAEGDQTKKASK
jgi:O-antigen biosynthesis protein WbqP